jgi:hypothetical protein
MGHEPIIIDYRGENFRQYKLFDGRTAHDVLSNALFLRKNIGRKQAFEKFFSEHYSLSSRYESGEEGKLTELANDFDCFVCGSDQIWNLDCTHGPVGPYFLSFAGGTRRVAYAPSLARATFKEEYFGVKERAQIAEWLSKFSAISVREQTSVPLIAGLTDIPVEVCVDPTLLLDASDYLPIMGEAPLKENALFLYMLSRNSRMLEYADWLAQELGLRIVYIGRRDIHFLAPSTNVYGIGPSEFLSQMAASSVVITNSFHATVFSLLFGKPFQTFATEKSGSRMVDLLTSLGLEGHLVDGSSGELPRPASASVLSKNLPSLKEKSLGFLSRALS